MILAKLALGAVGTLAFATVYTFREGTIRWTWTNTAGRLPRARSGCPPRSFPLPCTLSPDDKLLEAAATRAKLCHRQNRRG